MRPLKFIIGVGAMFCAVLLLAASYAAAQDAGSPTQRDFLLTWRALQSYAPAYFPGKVLPAPGSSVLVSFDLIENGKLADLSNETIYWYLNGKFIAGGEGLQATTFAASPQPGARNKIRAQINNYRDLGEIVVKTVEVPTARPSAVIEAPFPGGFFSASPVVVRGAPYFFGVGKPSDLSFTWTANGAEVPRSTPETQDDLVVNFTEAPEWLTVELTIDNPSSFFEIGSRTITLQRQ